MAVPFLLHMRLLQRFLCNKKRQGRTAAERKYDVYTARMPPEKMPPNIRKIKERIRRLTDDMEQRYKEDMK